MPDLTTVAIRPLRRADARTVADQHREGIPQGFLSQLATNVRVHLYLGISSAPRSGVWVAVTTDGAVVGFVAGTADVGRCYRSVLLREGLGMAWFGAPSLLHRDAWRKIGQTLTYPRREIARRTAAGAPEPTAELLSIAVDPGARGAGVASRLLAALEDAMIRWGQRGIYRVVTMAADPGSNGFYRKTGFRYVRSFEHHGVTMNLYHKDLAGESY